MARRTAKKSVPRRKASIGRGRSESEKRKEERDRRLGDTESQGALDQTVERELESHKSASNHRATNDQRQYRLVFLRHNHPEWAPSGSVLGRSVRLTTVDSLHYFDDSRCYPPANKPARFFAIDLNYFKFYFGRFFLISLFRYSWVSCISSLVDNTYLQNACRSLYEGRYRLQNGRQVSRVLDICFRHFIDHSIDCYYL